MEIQDSKANQGRALWGGGVHLLDCTIIPPAAPGVWVVEEVDTSWAAHMVANFTHGGSFPDIHIGHAATAQVASQLLCANIPVDRTTPWDGRGLGLALQLNGRPEEGKVLSREEMEALGYSWRILYRIDPSDGLPVDHHRPGSSPAAVEARDFLRGNLSARFLFIWTGETRSGTHAYVRVIMHDRPLSPAAIDVTLRVLAVLADPASPLPVPSDGNRRGYSGSGDKGKIMVWVGAGEGSHELAKTNEGLAADIIAALGLSPGVSLAYNWVGPND